MYPRNGYQHPSDDLGPAAPRSFLDYNFKCCCLFGIPIHVHYLLPAFFIFSFFFWARIIGEDASHIGYYILLILLQNIVLWETVLVHELGHCLAGWLVGGSSEKILLWPLGGLAYTKPPPAQVSNISGGGNMVGFGQRTNRCASIWIALGGPLTHIPHAIFWGLLLYWSGQQGHANVFLDCAPCIAATWRETIFVPITEWIDYDFLMLAFTMNVWLFVLNLFLPAYPLDGSRVFVNALRHWYDHKKVAQIYVVTNALLGVGFVLFSYLYLKNGSMCQFGGFWAVYQCYTMVLLIMAERETDHPILAES